MNPFYVPERKHKLGVPDEEIAPTILAEVKVMYESFIKEHNIDIVHAHNFHHFLPCHAMALTELREKGLATVLTIHEVWSEYLCKDLLEKSHWDAVITVSKHVE